MVDHRDQAVLESVVGFVLVKPATKTATGYRLSSMTMTSSEALAILRALANGTNPKTGAPIEQPGVLQDPDVIRALYTAVLVLSDAQPLRFRAKSTPPNVGRPWTSEQDSELLARFDSGCSIGEIARALGRTRGGIAARLVRLGRVETRREVYARAERTLSSSPDRHGVLDRTPPVKAGVPPGQFNPSGGPAAP